MAGKPGQIKDYTLHRVVLTNGETGADVGYGWGLYVIPGTKRRAKPNIEDLALERISETQRRARYACAMPTLKQIEAVQNMLVTLSLRKALKELPPRSA